MNVTRDNNRIPALIVTLNTDGVTPVAVQVNSDHKIMVNDATTGSGSSSENAVRDDNRVPAAWGVSSADGVTPVAIWGDALGRLLINSN